MSSGLTVPVDSLRLMVVIRPSLIPAIWSLYPSARSCTAFSPNMLGQVATASRRAAASLGIADDAQPGLQPRVRFDIPGKLAGIAYPFRCHNDACLLALRGVRVDRPVDGFPVDRHLGHKYDLRAGGQPYHGCDEAPFPAHDLYDENAVQRRGCVPDLVDSGYVSVDRRIEADGLVGAIHVVVYGRRHPGDCHIRHLAQRLRSPERAVPADDDQPFDVFGCQVPAGYLDHICILEIRATARVEYGPARMYDVAD